MKEEASKIIEALKNRLDSLKRRLVIERSP
jgi:hypothetical protein